MSGTQLIRGATIGALLLAGTNAINAQINPIVDIPSVSGEADFGRAVAFIGDITGDGISDIAVGDPNAPITGGSVRLIDGSTGATIATIPGAAGGERYGTAVAGVGDVNLDGIPDFAVGAPSSSAGPSFGGRFEIRSGASGNALLQQVLGAAASDHLGTSIAPAGDVNGDGRADVVVGAPQADIGGTDTGSIYVYSSNGTLLYQKNGLAAFHHLGATVGGGGDIDNDTVPDFIGGSTGTLPTGGYAIAYSGSTGGVLHTLTSGGTSDQFGSAIASAGDVNNDGYDDILVGATQDHSGPTGQFKGAITVFSGQTGGVLHKFLGVDNADQFGSSVAGAGDVNGDGYDDILGGAVAGGGPGIQDGYARLYSGMTGALVFHLPAVPSGNFGYSVAGGSDINGNGLSDIIVGAPNDGVGGSGFVRVYSGACGSIINYGTGCPGSSGPPALIVTGCVTPLGTVTTTVTNGPPFATTTLLLGINQASIPLKLCTLLVDPIVQQVTFTLDATGSFSFPSIIPLGTSGGFTTLQAWIQDASGPAGFTATNGVQIVVQ